MMCKFSCEDHTKKYIKTPLCGKCEKCCKRKIVLFDGKCFCDSYGMIKFMNEGCYTIAIYKNNLPDPVALVEPGCCFTLTSCPLYRIEIKCLNSCDCSECDDFILCYKGYICNNIDFCSIDCDCKENKSKKCSWE